MIENQSEEVLKHAFTEYANAVGIFLIFFKRVFDEDWEFSKSNLDPNNIRDYISENGTFLNPKIGDASNNWGNRGSLLEAYSDIAKVTDKIRVLLNGGPPLS